MQFYGFVLWKHLCKQANHIAAILNQKSCDFVLIKILAGNYQEIVIWSFANFGHFQNKVPIGCLRFDIFIKNKLVLALKVDLIDIDVDYH